MRDFPNEQHFLEALRGALEQAAVAEARRFAVAFSGGLDSTVLLAALARIRDGDGAAGAAARPWTAALRALHVDHGLHRDSAAWEAHCRGAAAELRVAYRSMRVIVDARSGAGLEAAAREARYAALAELLEEGETLLTAHHADDQLETLLLRLLRGTGVRGLRGILPRTALGGSAVLRPLLGVPRAELRAHAERWRLSWLEDPSNLDARHDRNYLRARVLGAVRERWPAASRSANRLAASMSDAEEILASIARGDLQPVAQRELLPAPRRDSSAREEPGRVALAALRELDAARQRNALRHAIRAAGLPMPDARQLEELRGGIAVTRPDARTRVQWPGGEARVYRDRLYLFAPQFRSGTADACRRPATDALSSELPDTVPAARGAERLAVSRPWSGPEGRLALAPCARTRGAAREPADDARSRGAACDPADDGGGGPDHLGLPDSWARDGLDVRFRTGGERLRPAGEAHHRSLKHWFQEQGVVPWMRDRIPLLYRRDRLVAVADLAVDEQARQAAAREPRWQVRWSEHPPIR